MYELDEVTFGSPVSLAMLQPWFVESYELRLEEPADDIDRHTPAIVIVNARDLLPSECRIPVINQ